MLGASQKDSPPNRSLSRDPRIASVSRYSNVRKTNGDAPSGDGAASIRRVSQALRATSAKIKELQAESRSKGETVLRSHMHTSTMRRQTSSSHRHHPRLRHGYDCQGVVDPIGKVGSDFSDTGSTAGSANDTTISLDTVSPSSTISLNNDDLYGEPDRIMSVWV